MPKAEVLLYMLSYISLPFVKVKYTPYSFVGNCHLIDPLYEGAF